MVRVLLSAAFSAVLLLPSALVQGQTGPAINSEERILRMSCPEQLGIVGKDSLSITCHCEVEQHRGLVERAAVCFVENRSGGTCPEKCPPIPKTPVVHVDDGSRDCHLVHTGDGRIRNTMDHYSTFSQEGCAALCAPYLKKLCDNHEFFEGKASCYWGSNVAIGMDKKKTELQCAGTGHQEIGDCISISQKVTLRDCCAQTKRERVVWTPSGGGSTSSYDCARILEKSQTSSLPNGFGGSVPKNDGVGSGGAGDDSSATGD